MEPMLKVIATLCAALFTGGALDISLVEHPVRMADMAIPLREFRHSYRRAAPWQASTAVICLDQEKKQNRSFLATRRAAGSQRGGHMSEQKSMPVYCTLPEADLRERVAELERTIAKKIVEVRELDDGYALRFPAEAGIVEKLGRFIALERVCCAFLNFSLRVKAGDGPVWLELTGSGEAKKFLRPTIERWTS
jgi:hypothetical protein